MPALDRSLFQPVSPMTVSRSLAEALDLDANAREQVLIELADRTTAITEGSDSLQQSRQAVLDWIQANVLNESTTKDTVFLEDQLDAYVAVNLTRAEVEMLAGALSVQYGTQAPAVYRMFRNSRKKALMRDSIHTVQARTAQLGYNAYGQNITWAVLDTGIDQQHPHFHNAGFAPGGTIAAAWDCTARGRFGRTVVGMPTAMGLMWQGSSPAGCWRWAARKATTSWRWRPGPASRATRCWPITAAVMTPGSSRRSTTSGGRTRRHGAW